MPASSVQPNGQAPSSTPAAAFGAPIWLGTPPPSMTAYPPHTATKCRAHIWQLLALAVAPCRCLPAARSSNHPHPGTGRGRRASKDSPPHLESLLTGLSELQHNHARRNNGHCRKYHDCSFFSCGSRSVSLTLNNRRYKGDPAHNKNYRENQWKRAQCQYSPSLICLRISIPVET